MVHSFDSSNSSSIPAPHRPVVAASNRSSVDATPIQTMSPDKQAVDKARQRAANRDNQIRKSAGLTMSKQNRNTNNHTSRWSSKKQDMPLNAVANFELCEAETILESNTIVEAARHMAAKRLDFVLVVDGMGRLVGIVTDKDLAFRVVAEELDPRQTTVSQVMTRDPHCVQSSLSMIDALTKMVQNHFRHLPVMEDEKIIGVLDIAKCLYDALQKLELADAAANQIATALETVGKEFAGVIAKKQSNNEALNYADTIRDCLASPKLSSIVGEGDFGVEPNFVVVNVKSNVIQAVKQMKARKETAALVTDDQGKTLAGIFTTKDILLRVVAAGLDPSTTTIIRVMTPHPDSSSPDTSIVEALRQMHNGHYLHLPVLTTLERNIIGIVDVLQLTYSMLEQLSALKGKNQLPLWHQLWSPDEIPDNVSIPGTSSQYSERRSDVLQNPPAYAPQTPSIIDDLNQYNMSIAFKIKLASGNDSSAILLTAEMLQIPTLRELEAESMVRFGVSSGNLYLVDEDEDLIPIRDDGELNKFVQLVTGKGKDRINLVLVDKSSMKASASKAEITTPLANSKNQTFSPLALYGSLALAGVGLAALGLFLLKINKP